MISRLRSFTSKKHICTTCFQTFEEGQILYRCQEPTCSGQAIDPEYERFTGVKAMRLGKILSSQSGDGRRFGNRRPEVRCDDCQRVTSTKICPHCHSNLPVRLDMDNRIIAIVGGRQTGKSHYIATLRQQMERVAAPNLGVHMQVDAESANRFYDDYEKPLFEDHKKIGITLLGRKDPLKFRVFRTTDTDTLMLSFFDSAGEDLEDLRAMSTQLRYIASAAAMLFLLDPQQIPAVRTQLQGLGSPLIEPNQKANPEYIVQRIYDLFVSEGLVKPGKKISIPVAFALTKIDSLLPILPPGSVLTRPGSHRGSLNLAEIDAVNSEIAIALSSWAPSLVSTIDHYFGNYRFFGVSSLGRAATGDEVTAVSPMRVEDPMLWLLHKFNRL